MEGLRIKWNNLQLLATRDLSPYNSFGVAAECRHLLEIHSEFDAIEWLHSNPGKVPAVLGGGSNVLLLHSPFDLIFLNRIMGIKILEETKSHVVLEVGGGENWHELVLHCVENDWGGIEIYP